MISMLTLKSSENKVGISYKSDEEIVFLMNYVQMKYDVNLLLEDEWSGEFSIEYYNNLSLSPQMYVDSIILGKDLANVIVDNNALKSIVLDIIKENVSIVNQYRSGNERSLNSLIGLFMKSNKGYNPIIVKQTFLENL